MQAAEVGSGVVEKGRLGVEVKGDQTPLIGGDGDPGG